MKDTAYRDLASEIGIMFRDDRPDMAVAFVDALIASGDMTEIDRWRRSNGESGADAVRNLLSRRIDTAPLATGGMAAIFAIPVLGRPGRYDAERVAEHLASTWGPGLISLAVDRSYRGIEGMPTKPADRLRIARIAATKGVAAAVAALPKVRRRENRAWDPCFIVCAATTEHDRDAYETGTNIVLDSQPPSEARRWSGDARRWAGHASDVCLPDLLGSAFEIARIQSKLKEIVVVSSWARGGLLDVLRTPDGQLLLTSEAGGIHRIADGHILGDARILATANFGGALASIRHSLHVARSH